ncbi:MAG: tRNA preQ1(34) S-adenosylmethionine ribosyltransferase-isomerase QueA [Candidatus Omnitrophota bacterium]|jgi:S-adenosylmethionine:tRNA ribosyltransferase-isomerase|nr:MAG: tRNA preQ1(34) S-adenosylmethionine ribosyltransferase-isomerase QueA [Candidatus Omnitrophota bacterium]
MDLSLFDYHLPEELIAQVPAPKRDASRLLVVDRRQQTINENVFGDIPEILSPGDMLVLNDTFVIPARLTGKKEPGGAAIEILLLEPLALDEWQVIAYRASRLKTGVRIVFSDFLSCEVLENLHEGKFRIRFFWNGSWEEILSTHGHIPLPPYINRKNGEFTDMDRERYQTVFARRNGALESAAAPTAGLHFTDDLLDHCRRRKIEIGVVTLRIGLDTFLPLRVNRVEDHHMHSESYVVPAETVRTIRQVRENGGKIVAVGTTVVRVLESATASEGVLREGEGHTQLYIYPGYQFRMVNAMITNFHLPRSTLLLLVSAFMGNDLRIKGYEYAVNHHFRFYSYGDAMLIL